MVQIRPDDNSLYGTVNSNVLSANKSLTTKKQKAEFNVAIIDSFSPSASPAIDLNGDGINDTSHGGETSHGKLIETYITANSKKPVLFLEVDKDKNKGLGASFAELISKIDSGVEIDAINISQSIGLYDNSNNLVRKNPSDIDLAQQIYPNDPKKVEQFLGNIAKGVLKNPNSPERKQILDVFKRSPATKKVLANYEQLIQVASKRNIPIYVSGSNNKYQINPLSLFEPVICLGASNAKGAQENYYSSIVSPVDKYAQGTYNIYKVKSNENKTGYDFTGDGKIDILDSEVNLSNGNSRAQLNDGKPIAPLLSKSKQKDKHGNNAYTKLAEILVKGGTEIENQRRVLSNQFKGFLFDARILAKALKNEAVKHPQRFFQNGVDLYEYIEDASSNQGTYVIFDGMDTTGNANFIFYREKKSNHNSFLFYDPANTGKQGAIGVITGTSWAAPKQLITDLNNSPYAME